MKYKHARELIPSICFSGLSKRERRFLRISEEILTSAFHPYDLGILGNLTKKKQI